MASYQIFLCLILFSFTQIFLGTCLEFQVGGDSGWVVPKSKNDDQLYNQWASKNRFIIGDTVHFKYKKDSVLVVTQEEYEKCKSSHPLFFSNNGDTVFKFERPGLFYFISGVTGHCERGLQMIIKVLEPALPPQSETENSTTLDSTHKGGAADHMISISSTAIVVLVMTFFGMIFM
ncbi:early nodulin-like protein 1 [Quillaja saponaria]|uniref:Early nodulin-like protein 1 n=1 Tax=Quillaja saponaria TaxID=32244 RepID=A0AAD7VKC4_QUISA|nr:early nodulin-like protein 1 [Quillaja saponaria]